MSGGWAERVAVHGSALLAELARRLADGSLRPVIGKTAPWAEIWAKEALQAV